MRINRHLYLAAVTVVAAQQLCGAPTWLESSREWLEDFFLTSRYSALWLGEGSSIIRPLWHLLRTHSPRVTVLGGARVTPDSYWYAQAYEFGKMCAQHNMMVITGGGPGIMEAAARGALAGNPRQIPLGISLHSFKDTVTHIQNIARAVNFETRQWLLLNFSCALVYFPGGVGTHFELTQALTLMDTKHMRKIPVVLVDKAYWQPLLAWLNNLVTKHKLIDREIIRHMHVVDSAQEAFAAIRGRCQDGREIFNLQRET